MCRSAREKCRAGDRERNQMNTGRKYLQIQKAFCANRGGLAFFVSWRNFGWNGGKVDRAESNVGGMRQRG